MLIDGASSTLVDNVDDKILKGLASKLLGQNVQLTVVPQRRFSVEIATDALQGLIV